MADFSKSQAAPTAAKADGTVIVRTEQVTRVYQVDALEVHALRGADMLVKSGEFILLMGRSGSGKTTLMNIIGGLDHPTAGSVELLGHDISHLSDRQLTELRRKDVGFVFQSFALMPTMSAFENVELPMRMIGINRRERRQRVMECLEVVGLTRWAKHRPQEMSGGQQQRVAIARSLVNHPKLVLADEPTGELDSTTGRSIMELFRAVVDEEGVTMIMTSHDPAVQEYVDYTFRMADGRVLNPR